MKVRQMMKRRQRVAHMNKVSAEIEARLRAAFDGLGDVVIALFEMARQIADFMVGFLKEQHEAGMLKTQEGWDG